MTQPGPSSQCARQADHWLTRGVIYEVFVREFSAEGTFKGVEKRLDAIRDLGVTTLWLMPIHPVGQERKKGPLGSPYAVADYGAVNPDFGREEDLTRLVQRAHALGLRVIIDWVINHSSWDNPLITQHPQWYEKDDSGRIIPPHEGWSDVAKLDLDSEALRAYLVEKMLHWMQACEVDGFRCDVASLVPVDFWEAAQQALEDVRPDIGLLAEAYDPRLMQRAFRLTYDYPWYHALRKVLRGQPIARLWQKHHQFNSRFPAQARRLRFIDNHDQRRCVSYLGPRASLTAAVLLLTSAGVPLIYNGQEIGDEAPSRAPALFHRHPLEWHRKRPGIEEHYRRLIRLRLASPALELGQTIPLDVAPDCRIICFLRVHEGEAVLVAVNLSKEDQSMELSEERLPAADQLLLQQGVKNRTELRQGRYGIYLQGWGWLVARLLVAAPQ